MAHPFDPTTVLIDWKDREGRGFTIADALAGCCVMGGTGSGKTSGPGTLLALAYLEAGFGGLWLCAKKDERRHVEELARIAGREDDLVIFDTSGRERFNFLDWEAERTGSGPALTINIVHLLDEIAAVIARGSGAGSTGGGGENRFFSDALHHLNMNLVDLPLFAGIPVSLPLLRDILNSAPRTLEEAADPAWQNNATVACPRILREAAEAVTGGEEALTDDFKECAAYWTKEFPAVSHRTRSIFTLMFSMLVRPFITRPLRRLFSEDTTVAPETAFAGKIIVVDIPVSEYRLAGQVAALCWKHCFQMAVLRRAPPSPGQHLRPVFLWADEAQFFLAGENDTSYQAVARSSGGCSVYLFQNREILISSIRNDATVDALLGNLQTKFFCQNSSPDTNKWAAELLGQRYVHVTSSNFGRSGGTLSDLGDASQGGRSAGLTRSEDRRFYVEPTRFTTLKRGGADNGFTVEAVVYNGGRVFAGDGGEPVPFKTISIRQR